MTFDRRRKLLVVLLVLFVLVAAVAAFALISLMMWDTNPTNLNSQSEHSSTTDHQDYAAAMTDIDVQLAWFYKPPDDGNLAILAKNYDTFILTHRDEQARDDLRNLGVDGPILQYLLFAEVVDPGSCTQIPWGNQVSYKQGDFCWIMEEHPDWILRDAAGDPIASGPPGEVRYVTMDPGNPGWRQFWLERAIEMQETFGWDGVFLDNVDASLRKMSRNGQLPAAYPDDASYQAAVEGFLQYLHTNYFEPEGRPLYANIIELRNPAVWYRYLQYLDGAMEEGWAVDWHDGYRDSEDWKEHIKRAERTQSLGKHAILVAQGRERDDRERQQFALASYLLVNDGQASFRYIQDTEHSPWLFDSYRQQLGEPRGQHFCLLDLVCVRRYSKGWVAVMPALESSRIVID